MIFFWIAVALGIGAVVAFIAREKGRSPMVWAFYGTVAPIIALPHVLIARSVDDEAWSPVRFGIPEPEHPCPHCGSVVRGEAIVCRHCHKPLYEGRPAPPAPDEIKDGAKDGPIAKDGPKRPRRDETASQWLDETFSKFADTDARDDETAPRPTQEEFRADSYARVTDPEPEEQRLNFPREHVVAERVRRAEVRSQSLASEAHADLVAEPREDETPRGEIAKLQAARALAVKAEAARAEAAKLEAARREAAKEVAKLEAAKAEAARLDAARAEAARIETAKLEAARIEAAKEVAKLEAARAEAAKLDAARAEAARLEAARIEAERIEAARSEAARKEAAKLEAARLDAEKAEAAKAEAARREAEKAAAAKAAQERAEPQLIVSPDERQRHAMPSQSAALPPLQAPRDMRLVADAEPSRSATPAEERSRVPLSSEARPKPAAAPKKRDMRKVAALAAAAAIVGFLVPWAAIRFSGTPPAGSEQAKMVPPAALTPPAASTAPAPEAPSTPAANDKAGTGEAAAADGQEVATARLATPIPTRPETTKPAPEIVQPFQAPAPPADSKSAPARLEPRAETKAAPKAAAAPKPPAAPKAKAEPARTPDDFMAMVGRALGGQPRAQERAAAVADDDAAVGSAGGPLVQQVQERLRDRGFDPGSIDGRTGPKTVQAIRAFQESVGMKADGRIDMALMERLGIVGQQLHVFGR